MYTKITSRTVDGVVSARRLIAVTAEGWRRLHVSLDGVLLSLASGDAPILNEEEYRALVELHEQAWTNLHSMSAAGGICTLPSNGEPDLVIPVTHSNAYR